MPEEGRNILRLFGTDIPGEVSIGDGLRKIKGVGFRSSKAIIKESGIDPKKNAGKVTDEEADKLEEVIQAAELPEYLLNRRGNPEEGSSKFLVSTDLEIQKRQDIEDMKKLGSYRGMRHRKGLPVRGQKTKSSFRGKSSVGVSKARIKSEGEEGEE